MHCLAVLIFPLPGMVGEDSGKFRVLGNGGEGVAGFLGEAAIGREMVPLCPSLSCPNYHDILLTPPPTAGRLGLSRVVTDGSGWVCEICSHWSVQSIQSLGCLLE